MIFPLFFIITIYKGFTNRLEYVIIETMDKDEKIMREVQDDMTKLLIKYQNNPLVSLAMVLKTAIDCYVAALGEEGTEKILENAIDSVKSGQHSIFSPEMMKKSLH